MKKIFSITAIICTLFTFTGCNKFLDIYPNDKLLEDQILGSQINLHNVLNGVYANMMGNSTYGRSLTQTHIEIMGQRYNLDRHIEGSTSRLLQGYQYNQSSVIDVFTGIWRAMYTNILEINYFIGLLERATVYIPENQKNILFGEAYGLRAMHHFDLLRLFGPVPALYDDDTTGIMPYSTNTTQIIQIFSLITAKEVMEKIIADLKTADSLLANDPIITDGIVKTTTIDPITNFYINRNHRMNYFAVKALQARVHLWEGNNSAAADAAREVIERGGRHFPWVTFNDARRTPDPDRIFSTEVIFGYRNENMYNLYREVFASNVRDAAILNPKNNRLETIFNIAGDIRFAPSRTWAFTADRNEERTGFKFAEPSIPRDTTFGYFQPLIRISEMYYILAEAENTFNYLDTVAENRSLVTLPSTMPSANLDAELEKEYTREFWGEGQIFFFYKRKNRTAIPNGNTDAAEISMEPQVYKVPIPLAEIEIRF